MLSAFTFGRAQDVKEVEGRANFPGLAFIAPEPVIVIATYDANDNPNVMVAAWGSQSDYDKIKIHLEEHKTTDNLRLKKAFTVSFATEQTIAECDYLGSVSGKEVPDKVKRAGLTAHKAPNVDAPIIDQFPVALECEMVSFDDYILIGKVVNVSADKSVLNADGKIDLAKMQTVVFDQVNGTYYSIGHPVGKAFEIGTSKFK